MRVSTGAIFLVAALWSQRRSAQIVDMGKFPDWGGQWRRVPRRPPRYDPSKPNGLGQQAPLTPEAQTKLEASLKDQAAGGQGLDVTYKCIPTGMPRMMSGVFPHEFVFTPDTTFLLFEFMINAPRRIYTDGRAWPQDLGEADLRRVLDRQVARYRRRRPLSTSWTSRRAASVHPAPSTRPASRCRRRQRRREGALLPRQGQSRNHPCRDRRRANSSLTRPWTATKNFRRSRNVLWTENNCTEGNNHVEIGNENYYLSGDGYLMPARKTNRRPTCAISRRRSRRRTEGTATRRGVLSSSFRGARQREPGIQSFSAQARWIPGPPLRGAPE